MIHKSNWTRKAKLAPEHLDRYVEDSLHPYNYADPEGFTKNDDGSGYGNCIVTNQGTSMEMGDNTGYPGTPATVLGAGCTFMVYYKEAWSQGYRGTIMDFYVPFKNASPSAFDGSCAISNFEYGTAIARDAFNLPNMCAKKYPYEDALDLICETKRGVTQMWNGTTHVDITTGAGQMANHGKGDSIPPQSWIDNWGDPIQQQIDFGTITLYQPGGCEDAPDVAHFQKPGNEPYPVYKQPSWDADGNPEYNQQQSLQEDGMIKEIMMASVLVLITSCGSSEAQMFTLSEARHWVDDHPNTRFLTLEEVVESGTSTAVWCFTSGALNGFGGGWVGADKDGRHNSVPGVKYPLAVYDKVSCGAQAVSVELPASFGSESVIKEPVPETIPEPVKIRIPSEDARFSPAVVVPGGTTILAD